MTTPTKQQIDRIIKATCELYQCGDCDRCEVYSDCFHHNKKVIIEWEKLKNIPKQGKIWLKGPVAEGTERLGGQAITRKCLLERGRLAN